MAKDVTIKVSKRGGPSVEATFSRPETLDDPRWKELVEKLELINEAACRNVIVALQSGARNHLDADAEDDGAAAVQAYVDGFKFGIRQPGMGGAKKAAPKLSAAVAKQHKFSNAQLEALAAAGMNVESLGG